MSAILHQTLVSRIALSSGLDLSRPYVGMSKAGDCARQIYADHLSGVKPTVINHMGAWLGYTFESRVIQTLGDELKPGRELSAFGGRVLGHTDAEWQGELIEIKSVSLEKLDRIRSMHRLPSRVFHQVQAYMRYGGYERAHVIFIPRDAAEPLVISDRLSIPTANRINDKFRRVLDALDAKRPPACECGRCAGQPNDHGGAA